MMRLQRIEGPIRIHQHVDGAILANQDREITGFQLSAVRGSRSFENTLGVCQEIRHKILIALEQRIVRGNFAVQIPSKNCDTKMRKPGSSSGSSRY
jgi:hypothetical protein